MLNRVAYDRPIVHFRKVTHLRASPDLAIVLVCVITPAGEACRREGHRWRPPFLNLNTILLVSVSALSEPDRAMRRLLYL